MSQLDQMDGITFERYLEQAFRSVGYEVRHVGKTGDYGADLILESGGSRTVVQAKRYSSPVGLDAVREAATARAHFSTDCAIVVTNSRFTASAVNLARSNHVELWDRDQLADLATRAAGGPVPSGAKLLGYQLASGAVPAGRLAVGCCVMLLAALAAGAGTLTSSTARIHRRRPRRR